MALIRSTILSEVRGSINGTTFARNRYGAYARNRTVPVNPQTAAQQAVRAALGASAQAWRTLTDGSRTLWENYAAATPVLNRLGETIHLSGQAMWNKYNTWYLSKALAAPVQPPSTPGLAITVTASAATVYDGASADPNSFEMTFTTGGTTVTNLYAFFISGPQSAGTKFFKGPWHYLETVSGVDRSNSVAIPWAVTVGQSFFIKVGYRDATIPVGKLGGDLVFGPVVATNSP